MQKRLPLKPIDARLPSPCNGIDTNAVQSKRHMRKVEGHRAGTDAVLEMNFLRGDMAQDSAAKRTNKDIESLICGGLELHLDGDRFAVRIRNGIRDGTSFHGFPFGRQNKPGSILPNIQGIVGCCIRIVVEGN